MNQGKAMVVAIGGMDRFEVFCFCDRPYRN